MVAVEELAETLGCGLEAEPAEVAGFEPGGRRLLTWSSDPPREAVRLWDVAAGTQRDDFKFVAETNPNLAANFENPRLMRAFGLILENLDGFGDLENQFVLRGIPHVLALRNSIESAQGPRTGWSGDGAPGDCSLRSFAVGALIQHFTKRLDRVAGVDFRLPTVEELDAVPGIGPARVEQLKELVSP